MKNTFAVGLLIGLGLTLGGMVFGVWVVKTLLAIDCLAISAIVVNAVVTKLARI